MKLSHKIYFKIAETIRQAGVHRFYKAKNITKPISPFKLVFFCGTEGINYLNASLVSIQKYWHTIPEIIIISDGTPIDDIRSQLLVWPKKMDFIYWKEAALYYESTGDAELTKYATDELWGKKYVSILYCATKYPILYSDTDILWYADIGNYLPAQQPVLKMCQDIENCYSGKLLQELQLDELNKTPPLNAGLIYANGNFSGYPGWKALCKYLADKPDNRTEQTAFAVLNNYYNPDKTFLLTEVLIKIDDAYGFKFTGRQYKQIIARHYVNMKTTAFWRDFVYMLFN